MAYRNKLNSPLLDFLKKSFQYPGKRSIGSKILEEALELVDNKICNCCTHIEPKRNNNFLHNVATLLNSMSVIVDKPKLLEVKYYLELQLNPECC